MKILRNVTLRDFDQEDIHRFFTYGGREMYEKNPAFSTVPDNVKLGSLKRGKFKEADIKQEVKITFPLNHKVYSSSGLIYMWNEKDKLERGLDAVILVNDGIMTFPGCPFYPILAAILTKYRTQGCSWNYRFIKIGENQPKPILTVPQDKKDWADILKAITEYLICLRLFYGNDYRVYFHNSKTPDPYQKHFSDVKAKMISFIPTILNIGYSKLLSPIIKDKLSLKLHNGGRVYNTGLYEKLKRYVERNYKDLVIVSLGDGSCFINPKRLSPDDIEVIRKEANPDRRRTPLDWILWGYDNDKKIIFTNDLDAVCAMAHEVGHYLIDKSGGTKKWLQDNTKKGPTKKKYIQFVAGILGFFGPIGEDLGIIYTWLLRYPTLYSEFMASYLGLEVLREAGATEAEIEEAKEYFRAAYGSYLDNTAKISVSASTGRLWGESARFIWKIKKKLKNNGK